MGDSLEVLTLPCPTCECFTQELFFAYENNMSGLTEFEVARLRWMELNLRLPDAGVLNTFPDELACHARLVEIRWPNGVHCPRCHEEFIGFLEGRQTFHCQTCLFQFTSKSYSLLHRSRVSLTNWFQATETIIQAYSHDAMGVSLTGKSLASQLGISYAATCRLRGLIMGDIAKHGHDSLIARCICIESISRPQGLPEGSEAYFLWIHDQYTLRSERLRNF